MIFEFEGCVLDVDKQELGRDGRAVHVEPQVLAVLTYLVEHAERVVTKIELLDEVWGDRFVSESALTSRIKLARQACGDNGREQRIIKTVHSRGYRFVAEVTASHPTGRGTAPPAAPLAAPPAAAGSGPAHAGTPPRGSSSVFGRERELALLRAALGDAARSDRAAVLVCGGLGAGSSTLVAEFLERIDGPDDWVVARGQCIRTRGGVEPYFPLLDALGSLARSSPDLVAGVLERVAPSWLAQMPQLIDHDGFERLERRLLGATPTRMLREGSELFGELARVRPTIVVLEDLHHADDCTLDVLDLLLQRRDPARLLLVGTGRPESDALASIIDPAAANGRVTVIELPPLDRDSIASIAADRLGATLPDELVSIIEVRCGGTPLFAEEIVLSWLRAGRIEVADGLVRPATDLNTLEAEIPTTVAPLIERELAAIDPDERAVLEACAVAGHAFAAATIASALDRSVVEIEDALAGIARRRGLIGATGAEPWPDGTVSATYSFTQQLFREVIYDRIGASRRAGLHGRVGAALETGLGVRAGDLALGLADHFALAGDVLRSVRHRCVAGAHANARSAHAHTVSLLTRALDDLGDLGASDERDRSELEVRMTLGPALVATRGWFDPSVSANYERALELCDDDTLGAEAAAARYGLATVSELSGDFERTESLLAPLLAPDAPGNLALEAHELVACSMFHQGKFDSSSRTARAVLESWDEDAYSVLMARIAEHPASSCSSWLSLDLWALGRSDESLALAVRAVELGERNQYALSTAVQQRAMLHQLRHETEACIEWADRCRQVGVEQSFPMRTIQADIYKGWALAATSSGAEGVELIDRGLTRFREAGATLNEAYYLGLYADAVLRVGDPDRAVDLIDDAMRVRTSRTYFYEAELWRVRAAAALAAARDDAVATARSALDDGLAVAGRQGAIALELRLVADRLELETAHGDPDGWASRLSDLLAVYDGQEPVPHVVRARALLSG